MLLLQPFLQFFLLLSWLLAGASNAAVVKRTDPSCDSIDLFKEWTELQRTSPAESVKVNAAGHRKIEPGKSLKFTTSPFEGCTIIVLMGDAGVSIGHMREKTGSCNTLENFDFTLDFIDNKLEPLPKVFKNDQSPRSALIFGTLGAQSTAEGLTELKDFLGQNGFEDHVKYSHYTPRSAFSTRQDPFQKMMVIWDSPVKENGGDLRLYFESNDPTFTLRFDQNMRLRSGSQRRALGAACAIRPSSKSLAPSATSRVSGKSSSVPAGATATPKTAVTSQRPRPSSSQKVVPTKVTSVGKGTSKPVVSQPKSSKVPVKPSTSKVKQPSPSKTPVKPSKSKARPATPTKTKTKNKTTKKTKNGKNA